MALLDAESFASTDQAASSPFDTLWTGFARSNPRLSPPRSPSPPYARRMSSVEAVTTGHKPGIDLRALEYVSDYDSNLMCPICHVPFVEPVALDCDHTFCSDCFEEYRAGGPSTDRSKCPACRSYHLGRSRKASRLIKNMCNDIRVRCPNEACSVVMARGCIEQHATKECPEEQLLCPDTKCAERTKRRNFVPEQCIHKSHVECDCGATIQFGRGEWIRHKDEECPKTISTASTGQKMSGPSPSQSLCPGASFGCIDVLTPDIFDAHLKSCPLARLAPYMKKQNLLLQSLQEQLTMTKLHNEALETGFERLNNLITETIQAKLDRPATTIVDDNASVSDIEEIPRTDLLLPPSAHFQSLPLSPDTLHTFDPYSLNSQQQPHHSQYRSLDPLTQHLLHTTSTHDSHLSNIDNHLQTISAQLNDLDARSSMALMNETLRIREDLNILNGAMHSTRTQVQWLLNRERILGQREAMVNGGAGMRGRPPLSQQPSTNGPSCDVNSSTNSSASGSSAVGTASTTPTPAGPSITTSPNIPPATNSQRPSIDRNMSSAWSNLLAPNPVGSTSGHTSAATSPIFGAARPSLRRGSGGSSQERVKL